MASTSTGISGTALTVATLGAVLVYAGLRGVNPLQAARDVASGKPPAVPAKTSTLTSVSSTAGGSPAASVSNVVNAAARYSGDKYSQLRRTQAGYSDCSSFVDKAFHDVGIPYPAGSGVKWPTTTTFRLSGVWQTIPQSSAQPGDIAVAVGHMVLVTGSGGSSGIGQENSSINVHSGPISSLFSSSQHYVFRRYIGTGGSENAANRTANGLGN